jgi:hypothetical protein
MPRLRGKTFMLAQSPSDSMGRVSEGLQEMITVFGEERGFRVVWFLEEMGLAYRLRSVDLLAGVKNDPEFSPSTPPGSYQQSRTAKSSWSSRLRSWST